MQIDPTLRTGVGKPQPKAPSKHRWRDIGGGMIKCENTGRVMPIAEARSVPEERSGHIIVLNDQQWAKLEALAAHKSTPKKTVTPQECVDAFIASCVTEATWEHPTKTAARHRGRNATTDSDSKTETKKHAGAR